MNTRQRLLRLGTGPVSDALDKGGAMDHEIRPWSASARMAGPAFTVQVHTADILMVSKALAECPEGHVLVIDGHGEKNTALWGGLTTLSAWRKALAGVVVDGAIRDLADIRGSKLPVFARAVVPNAGGAQYAGKLQVAVACGGVVVHPGDWLVGDDDGVVVIPASRLEESLEKATRIVEAEKRIAKAIRAGVEIATLLRVEETLERKAKEIFVPQLQVEKK
ncbi:MAG TPA: RraA family protein [Bryobacteraceae bacterium]|nr:RraA family protein [Bryobacteraceae bacterium]